MGYLERSRTFVDGLAPLYTNTETLSLFAHYICSNIHVPSTRRLIMNNQNYLITGDYFELLNLAQAKATLPRLISREVLQILVLRTDYHNHQTLRDNIQNSTNPHLVQPFLVNVTLPKILHVSKLPTEIYPLWEYSQLVKERNNWSNTIPSSL